MYQLNKHKTQMPRRCSGFSIVELMIAMVITLILLAGIGQIFQSSRKSFTIQDSLGRQQENGRYVVDNLAQDLRRAGYLGGAVAVEVTANSLPKATGADTCTGTAWATLLDTPVFGLDNTAAGYNCIPNYLAGSGDVIAVRYGAPWELDSITDPLIPVTPKPNKIYLHSNPKEPKTARLYLRSALPAKAPGDRQAELVAHAYYIANSGQTCAYQGVNRPIPSLYRVSLNGSSQPGPPEEIASGIERLQILYGIDNAGADYSVDTFVKASAVADWDQVVAIRFWILTRADCPETGYTNTTTYQMGDGEDFTPPANDHYRRQLYQTTVQLRNNLEAS